MNRERKFMDEEMGIPQGPDLRPNPERARPYENANRDPEIQRVIAFAKRQAVNEPEVREVDTDPSIRDDQKESEKIARQEAAERHIYRDEIIKLASRYPEKMAAYADQGNRVIQEALTALENLRATNPQEAERLVGEQRVFDWFFQRANLTPEETEHLTRCASIAEAFAQDAAAQAVRQRLRRDLATSTLDTEDEQPDPDRVRAEIDRAQQLRELEQAMRAGRSVRGGEYGTLYQEIASLTLQQLEDLIEDRLSVVEDVNADFDQNQLGDIQQLMQVMQYITTVDERIVENGRSEAPEHRELAQKYSGLSEAQIEAERNRLKNIRVGFITRIVARISLHQVTRAMVKAGGGEIAGAVRAMEQQRYHNEILSTPGVRLAINILAENNGAWFRRQEGQTIRSVDEQDELEKFIGDDKEKVWDYRQRLRIIRDDLSRGNIEFNRVFNLYGGEETIKLAWLLIERRNRENQDIDIENRQRLANSQPLRSRLPDIEINEAFLRIARAKELQTKLPQIYQEIPESSRLYLDIVNEASDKVAVDLQRRLRGEKDAEGNFHALSTLDREIVRILNSRMEPGAHFSPEDLNLNEHKIAQDAGVLSRMVRYTQRAINLAQKTANLTGDSVMYDGYRWSKEEMAKKRTDRNIPEGEYLSDLAMPESIRFRINTGAYDVEVDLMQSDNYTAGSRERNAIDWLRDNFPSEIIQRYNEAYRQFVVDNWTKFNFASTARDGGSFTGRRPGTPIARIMYLQGYLERSATQNRGMAVALRPYAHTHCLWLRAITGRESTTAQLEGWFTDISLISGEWAKRIEGADKFRNIWADSSPLVLSNAPGLNDNTLKMFAQIAENLGYISGREKGGMYEYLLKGIAIQRLFFNYEIFKWRNADIVDIDNMLRSALGKTFIDVEQFDRLEKELLGNEFKIGLATFWARTSRLSALLAILSEIMKASLQGVFK